MADDTVKTRKPGYVTTYTPSLLESIARKNQRQKIGITEDALPFKGLDTWNAYEFTWLGIKGKPEVAMAKFLIPANSANLIESKSLKHQHPAETVCDDDTALATPRRFVRQNVVQLLSVRFHRVGVFGWDVSLTAHDEFGEIGGDGVATEIGENRRVERHPR